MEVTSELQSKETTSLNMSVKSKKKLIFMECINGKDGKNKKLKKELIAISEILLLKPDKLKKQLNKLVTNDDQFI
jgi:hypothetical protein